MELKHLVGIYLGINLNPNKNSFLWLIAICLLYLSPSIFVLVSQESGQWRRGGGKPMVGSLSLSLGDGKQNEIISKQTLTQQQHTHNQLTQSLCR